MQGIAGMLLSNSSKSMVAVEGVAKDADRRLVGPIGANAYADKSQERDLSQERDNGNIAKQLKTDKYSPVFSSVNRKKVANLKLENSKTQVIE